MDPNEAYHFCVLVLQMISILNVIYTKMSEHEKITTISYDSLPCDIITFSSDSRYLGKY